MSVSSVTSAFASYAKNVTSGGGGSSATSSAAQEANETPEVTRKEAARGDKVAVAKLARLQQHSVPAASTPAQEPGKGATVDHVA